MKKVLTLTLVLVVVFAAYLAYNATGEKGQEAIAKGKTYEGVLYVAGMGGHFASAQVVIDPSDAAAPIKIGNLDRIVIGSKSTHPTHDARIDVRDNTKMYWSTYKIDKEKGEENRMMHVGVSDLKTGAVIKDVPIKLDDRVKWTGAVYCASGQTKNSFLPVTMTGEAYIDVLNKDDLSLKHRVFLDKQGYTDNYLFFHGINSPDMKNFAVSINMTEKWAAPNTPGAANGKIDMLLLDLAALEKGEVKVVKKNTITGDPKKTKTFRQTFTPDGKYLLQSGADRFYLLDGKSLELKDEEMVEGENHDAMPTPDGKYAILTLRKAVASVDDPEGKATVIDGLVQLYDINAKKVVGGPVSVCYDCHKKMGIPGNAVLCGLDGNLK